MKPSKQVRFLNEKPFALSKAPGSEAASAPRSHHARDGRSAGFGVGEVADEVLGFCQKMFFLLVLEGRLSEVGGRDGR